MTTSTLTTAPMSALRQLVEAYDLAPVAAAKKSEHIDVHVQSVAALEVFADAVEKPIVSKDGDRFVVSHEVDGVPALFWSERTGATKTDHCRLVISGDNFVGWQWCFYDPDDILLGRSAVYENKGDAEESAVTVFGLDSTEQVQPGATWYGHGHETVSVEVLA